MADKNPVIGQFFKFLRDKEDREIPLQAQFTYTPDDIDWEGLAYNIKDLNLIKDTDNLDKIIWEKVPQNDFDVLRWVIQNAPEKLDKSKIDYNAKGVVGLLAKTNPDLVDWSNYKIDTYVKAMQAVRSGGDKIDWDRQVDYSSYPTVKYLVKNAPDKIDKSQVDMSDEKFASLFSG